MAWLSKKKIHTKKKQIEGMHKSQEKLSELKNRAFWIQFVKTERITYTITKSTYADMPTPLPLMTEKKNSRHKKEELNTKKRNIFNWPLYVQKLAYGVQNALLSWIINCSIYSLRNCSNPFFFRNGFTTRSTTLLSLRHFKVLNWN